MLAKPKFLLQTDLAERYGLHKRAILRWRKAGKCPEPVIYLPNGWPAWSEETVARYERASIANKPPATTRTDRPRSFKPRKAA